jgi:hypothetical protein
MSTASDPGIREYAETDGTFFTILYNLRQQTLQTNFIRWSDANGSWLRFLFVCSSQLLQVI